MNEIDDIKRRAGINEVAAWDTPEFHEKARDPNAIAAMWMDKNDRAGEMMTFMALLGQTSPHQYVERMAKVALAIRAAGGDKAMMDFLSKATDLNGKLTARAQ